jgi:transcriptional regulator with XRE-family HTH domain
LVEYRQPKSTNRKSARRPPDPAFGARLSAARRQAGLTQRELAERAGVTLNSIWRYETGRRPEDYDVLARLGEAVGSSVDFLLRGGGPSSQGVAEQGRAWDAALRPLLASSGLRLATDRKMRTRLDRAWRTLNEERKEDLRNLVRRAVALAAAVQHILPEASARAVNQEISAELSATIAARILGRA